MIISTKNKIFNNFNKQKNNTHTVFKGGEQKLITSQLKNVVENPVSKNIFAKLCSIAGLSSIIAWTIQLNNRIINNPSEKDVLLSKLNELNKYWQKEANSLMEDSAKAKIYMNMSSNADTYETLNDYEADGKALNGDIKLDDSSNIDKMLPFILDKKNSKSFMQNIAAKRLETLIGQTEYSKQNPKALLSLDEINTQLVLKAKELKNNPAFAEIFNDLSNITKMFTLSNLTEILTETTKTMNKGLFAFIKSSLTPKQDTVINTQQPDNNIAEEEYKNSISEFEKYLKNEFETQQADVDFSTYQDYIEDLYKISKQFENNRKLMGYFISAIMNDNRVDSLKDYRQYMDIGEVKLDFMNYLTLRDVKRFKGLELTLDDFLKIDSYKNVLLKYYSIKDKYPLKTELAFRSEASLEDKLQVIKEYFRIMNSLNENDLIKMKKVDYISDSYITTELEDVILAKRWKCGYRNILKYLYGANFIDALRLNNDDDMRTLISVLKRGYNENDFKNLASAVRSEKFDNFIPEVHGRMRFIERIVFPAIDDYESVNLKDICDKKIDEWKQKLQLKERFEVEEYSCEYRNEDGSRVYKHAPCFVMDNMVIGLDAAGMIHTIYKKRI